MFGAQPPHRAGEPGQRVEQPRERRILVAVVLADLGAPGQAVPEHVTAARPDGACGTAGRGVLAARGAGVGARAGSDVVAGSAVPAGCGVGAGRGGGAGCDLGELGAQRGVRVDQLHGDGEAAVAVVHPVQRDDRDRPPGAALVLGVGGDAFALLAVAAIALGAVQRGADGAVPLGTDLDGADRVVQQPPVPAWVAVAAGVGGVDQQPVALVVVAERAGHPAGGEQQQVGAGERTADAAGVGPELVDHRAVRIRHRSPRYCRDRCDTNAAVTPTLR
ncbi:hypothetical protein Athai_44810 [Actinocatenispora thailandica]|uniref:Uncharacterized protein n=1 Tax=Actinocatenispora thailandica TaxID=227318 RepID=A0A7R7HYB9_9ACTN|nr:hypothetical protein [Actinocatenispora thailandica]BCJ36978.1 hypothetical protein Athai_44810 [Actinocatenispora thailandica]